MEGFMSGVGIGLSIIALLVGILLLFLLDLGIGAAAERLGLMRRSRPISLFPERERQDGTLAGSGPEVPENNQMLRTAPGKSERRR